MLFPQSNGIRETTDLSGLWDFQADPRDAGEKEAWFKGFDATVRIAVPGSFNEQLQNDTFEGVDLFNYLGAVWYQKRFFVPEGMADGTLWLRFGAVSHAARVWLNGQLLGEHRGGSCGSWWNGTRRLHPVRTGKESRRGITSESRSSVDRLRCLHSTRCGTLLCVITGGMDRADLPGRGSDRLRGLLRHCCHQRPVER